MELGDAFYLSLYYTRTHSAPSASPLKAIDFQPEKYKCVLIALFLIIYVYCHIWTTAHTIRRPQPWNTIYDG